MLGQFGEDLSKAITETVSAKFRVMLAELAENVGSLISPFKVRVAALERATTWMGRDGATDSINAHLMPTLLMPTLSGKLQKFSRPSSVAYKRDPRSPLHLSAGH